MDEKTLDKDFLKNYIPFSELEDEYLDQALEAIQVVEFSKSEMLFKRNKPLDDVYFLFEGSVNLIDSMFTTETLAQGCERVTSALNLENPSSVSCVAASDIQVFTIERSTLDRLVSWSQSAVAVMDDVSYSGDGILHVEEVSADNANDWMSSLLQSPLFARIPVSQVHELFLKFEDWRLEQGDLVVKEGEVGDFFYVIAQGQVQVKSRAGSVDITLSEGDYFGEEALIADTSRNATVTMLSNGMLKRLNKQDFIALLKEPVVHYLDESNIEGLGKPYQLIDVKMPVEHRLFHVADSVNMPLTKLRSLLDKFDHEHAYIVTDDSGGRADIAAHLICQAGYDGYVLRGAHS